MVIPLSPRYASSVLVCTILALSVVQIRFAQNGLSVCTLESTLRQAYGAIFNLTCLVEVTMLKEPNSFNLP